MAISSLHEDIKYEDFYDFDAKQSVKYSSQEIISEMREMKFIIWQL